MSQKPANINESSQLNDLFSSSDIINTAIELANESIVITDVNGFIVYANQHFIDVTGYNLIDILGKRPSMWRSQRHTEVFYQNMWQQISEGYRWDGHVTNIKKNGEPYHVHLKIAPITDVCDQIKGYIAIQSDITYVDSEIQFVSDLRQVMIDDFKNPITDMLENLPKATDDNKIKQLQPTLTTMQNKVNALINFMRLDNLDLLIEENNIQSIVDNLKVTLAPLLTEKKATIQIEKPLPTIRCDGKLIGDVFWHLIINAIKYSPNNPTITIDWQYEDKQVFRQHDMQEIIISVKDNGQGINKAEQQKLFRLSQNGLSDEHKTSGLGLATVKKILDLHNSKIWFETSENQGTTFYFTLSDFGR